MNTLRIRLLWLWPSLILGALGLTQLYSIWSGQAQGLLHPTFHPFVLISGILLTLLSLLRLVVSLPMSPASPLKVSALSWGRIVVGGLLVIMVIGFQKSTPKTGYTALAFDNRGLDDQVFPPMSQAYKDATADGATASDKVMDLEVVDLLYAAGDPDLMKSMEGRHVRFIGQLLPLDDHSFQVVRLLMYCCAADAQPVGLVIKGQATGMQKMDWIQVEGTAHFEPSQKTAKVDIKLDQVHPTATPKEIFLY